MAFSQKINIFQQDIEIKIILYEKRKTERGKGSFRELSSGVLKLLLALLLTCYTVTMRIC